jgi:CubicO group peptidase (beta-lactamase class C family)
MNFKLIIVLFVFPVSVTCNGKIKSRVKQVVSSDGLTRITQFNDSCMTAGMWTGTVILSGNLEDGIVFSKSWGFLSVGKQTKMSDEAIFDLASLTKPIATATALAICMDRKLVDISAPFTQYLSEYKGKLSNVITVQDLARHLSGLDNRKPYIEEGKVVESTLLLSSVHPVGEKYEYSCSNYILLGLIVEKVTGEPLDQFCQSTIFAPLKMGDTHWSPLSEPDPQRTVQSDFTPKCGVVSDESARAARHPIGNAGLFSTARDLAKYCLMILQDGKYDGKKLLSERAIQLLTTKPDSKSPVAFGWRVDSEYNPHSFSERTLSHTGYTGNSVWIDLDQRKFVIILTNRKGDHDRSEQARINLAEHLLKEIKNN